MALCWVCVCETVWSGFCVWDSLEWVWESECVLCVCGTVWSGFGRVSVQQVALCFVCVCWYHVVVSRRN